jgi:PadR family transcriptional regulator PadR
MLELCILNAIDGTRLYGYDIVRRLREIDALVVGEGTVYPILSRLRREGFLDTSLEESAEGPARKYYMVLVTGLWWMLLGLLACKWPGLIRHPLRPFADGFNRRHALAISGAGLLLFVLLAGFIAIYMNLR